MLTLHELERRIAAYKAGIDSHWEGTGGQFSPGSMEYEEWRRGLDAAQGDRRLYNLRLRQLRVQAARLRGTHSNQQWADLVAEFQGRCVRCGTLERPVQKDHIVPLYQGGSDSIENMQPICNRCNTQKGPENMNWAAYRRDKGFGDC